jgi:hypothetical protein
MKLGHVVARGIPSDDVARQVENLVAAFLRDRGNDESFHEFATRKSDEELVAIASGECGTPIEAHTISGAPRS